MESELMRRYADVRARTEALAAPLSAEDCQIQSMPDVSPTKWHLGHTTWFFETFLLQPYLPGWVPEEPTYAVLFNSYYNAVGEQHPRPRRGQLSRPSLETVMAWRERVDAGMAELEGQLEHVDADTRAEIASRLDVGVNHEEQHQELLLTDIKHVLAQNPMDVAYRKAGEVPAAHRADGWTSYAGGVFEVGHAGPGFTYDNELPRHRALVEPFELCRRLVTNGEFREFILNGGYARPELWLSDGWTSVQQEGWEAPLYWERDGDGGWLQRTLGGRIALPPDQPVCHISYYEADAFARWAGCHIPTEFEWEIAAAEHADLAHRGTLLDDGDLHPVGRATPDDDAPAHLLGEVWEWTASAYLPYRGYAPAPGALGEYNGKFMSGQMVLRGGSCATGKQHIRTSYRNFFPPGARWQFSGLRLCKHK